MAIVFKERLTAFYRHYVPAKLGDVDKLLAKAAGNEEKLFQMLVDKYGPEPEPEEAKAAQEEDDNDDSEGQDEGEGGADGGAAEEGEVDGAPPPTVTTTRPGAPLDTPSGGPLEVVYCPVNGMPAEYCEYTPEYEACLPWIEQNAPWVLPEPDEEGEGEEEGGDGEEKKKKKKSKRGGQGPKKKAVRPGPARPSHASRPSTVPCLCLSSPLRFAPPHSPACFCCLTPSRESSMLPSRKS